MSFRTQIKNSTIKKHNSKNQLCNIKKTKQKQAT